MNKEFVQILHEKISGQRLLNGEQDTLSERKRRRRSFLGTLGKLAGGAAAAYGGYKGLQSMGAFDNASGVKALGGTPGDPLNLGKAENFLGQQFGLKPKPAAPVPLGPPKPKPYIAGTDPLTQNIIDTSELSPTTPQNPTVVPAKPSTQAPAPAPAPAPTTPAATGTPTAPATGTPTAPATGTPTAPDEVPATTPQNKKPPVTPAKTEESEDKKGGKKTLKKLHKENKYLNMTQERKNIANFIKMISEKNYAEADKYLQMVLESKIATRIEKYKNITLF